MSIDSSMLVHFGPANVLSKMKPDLEGSQDVLSAKQFGHNTQGCRGRGPCTFHRLERTVRRQPDLIALHARNAAPVARAAATS